MANHKTVKDICAACTRLDCTGCTVADKIKIYDSAITTDTTEDTTDNDIIEDDYSFYREYQLAF